jgi:hypothetical protein
MIPPLKLGRSGSTSFRVAVDRPIPGMLESPFPDRRAIGGDRVNFVAESRSIDCLVPPLQETGILTKPLLNDWVQSRSSATTSVFVAFKPMPPCRASHIGISRIIVMKHN